MGFSTYKLNIRVPSAPLQHLLVFLRFFYKKANLKVYGRGFFENKNSKAITIILEKAFQKISEGFRNLGSVVHKQNKGDSHLKMLKEIRNLVFIRLSKIDQK